MKAVLSFVVVIVNVHLQRQPARYALLFFFVRLDLSHFDQFCKRRIASAYVLATKL